MKNFLLFLFLIRTAAYGQELLFHSVEVDTNFSFRGLSVVDDRVAWLSGNVVGKTLNGGKDWKFGKVKGFETSDFRSIYAFDGQRAIIANAGSPASVLLTEDGGETWNPVFEKSDKLAFIDGIDFWNEKEGLVYGDPLDGRLFLMRTRDGGNTWDELPAGSRPLLMEGEASFAASGTGIRCFEPDKIVISTGGKVSRMFFSEDKGKSWITETPPIIKGKSSTGIFSLAFINNSMGIIVGGDYLSENSKTDHVFYTVDGGKNWLFPDKATGGYRECVEFITEGCGVAVGPGGTDISFDAGKTWSPVKNESGFHVIRKARKGELIIAAGKRKISRVSFK